MGAGRPKNKKFRAELQSYFRQNPTANFADAAKHFGLTRARIAQVADELGIEGAEDVSATIAEIYRLGGLKPGQLAMILDVQRPQLSRWANKQAKAQAATVARLSALLRALKHASRSSS